MKFLILIFFLVYKNAKRKSKTFFAVVSEVSFDVYSLVNLRPSVTGVLSTRELCSNKSQNLRLRIFLKREKSHIENYILDNYKIMFEVALCTILYLIYK